MQKDRCVVLGGILYYVDPVMKDQARLVVLNKKWLEVTYCKGCLTYVFLSQSGTRVEACLLPDQTSETIARELVAGVLADMEQLRNCFPIMFQLSVRGDSGCVQHD